MAISRLANEKYQKVAELRAKIVALLDEAFGEGYVVVVGHWDDPDGPGAWWNKRFKTTNPETIRRFIEISRAAENRLTEVRRMAETDAAILMQDYQQQLDRAVLAFAQNESQLREQYNEAQKRALTLADSYGVLQREDENLQKVIDGLRLKVRAKRKRK